MKVRLKVMAKFGVARSTLLIYLEMMDRLWTTVFATKAYAFELRPD
jgi:hypothetical protein